MDLAAQITREAERCVACGLCLNKCPTYCKTRTEAESPRGRIVLMAALATGTLALNERLESHLSTCLDCRACERVCPAKVAYGTLLAKSRALVVEKRKRTRFLSDIQTMGQNLILGRPRWLAVAGQLAHWYQRSGLQRGLRLSGLLKLIGLSRLDSLLPNVPKPKRLREYYVTAGVRQGTVSLFRGCVASIFDLETLKATIKLLNWLGYDVRIPPGQTCCGAVHRHSGYFNEAVRLMNKNIRAFALDTTPVPNTRHTPGRVDAIISCASGCTVALTEYGNNENNETLQNFSKRVIDINQFLTSVSWPKQVPLTPLNKKIAVHEPCSLNNVLGGQKEIYRLLEKIPKASVLPLPENHICCGGAGTYFLTQPQMADSLRADKLAHLQKLTPDIVVTANIGCALHLSAGLRQAGLDIEVLHPVALLVRQLQTKTGT